MTHVIFQAWYMVSLTFHDWRTPQQLKDELQIYSVTAEKLELNCIQWTERRWGHRPRSLPRRRVVYSQVLCITLQLLKRSFPVVNCLHVIADRSINNVSGRRRQKSAPKQSIVSPLVYCPVDNTLFEVGAEICCSGACPMVDQSTFLSHYSGLVHHWTTLVHMY